jgi:8-oxo-dGTP pyrophosphatase MutT (NUDIX family)
MTSTDIPTQRTEHKMNRFGDLIHVHHDDGAVLERGRDDKHTTHKVFGKASRPIPDDLVTIYESPSLSFYGNGACVSKCPNVQSDGTIISAAIVVFVNKESVLLAKDRTKHYFTVPCGSCNLDESRKSAAVRECYEETGLALNEDDVVGPFATTRADMVFYDTDFDVEMTWFYVSVSLSEEKISEIRSYSDEEIERVDIVHLSSRTTIDTEDVESQQDAKTFISSTHRFLYNIAWNAMQARGFPYVKNLTLL